jgi:ATP-binding cassette subfamily F protein 3
MVRSMIKELDAMERVEIEPTLPQVHFSFAPVTRAGNVVLTVANVSHAYDGNGLFKNMSCTIMRGKKVALIAANGMGKTTLFNLIADKLPLQHGSITFGHNVTTAYFEQDQTRVMNKDNTVLQEVFDACSSVPEQRIRSFLGSFLFSGEETKKKIGQLSGGEKNRVAMVKVLLQNANMLLLDEPTNHLDLYAKDVLQQALQRYEGTILFVSHDHDFVQQVADNILELTPNGLHLYNGDYESYLYHKKVADLVHQQDEIQKKDAEPSNKETAKNSYQQRQLKKQLGAIEMHIKKLEAKRDTMGERLSHLMYGTQEYDEMLSHLSAIDQELEQNNDAWEQIMQEYIALEE